MKTFNAVFCFFLLWSNAFARIGDTPEQSVQRYGSPYKTKAPFAYYKKAGLLITTELHEGKTEFLLFRKVEENVLGKGVEISDNELEKLLSSSGGERIWKKLQVISVDREWGTEDGELYAVYKTFDNTLMILTKGYLDRATAAKKAKENKTLEGF